MPRKTPLLLTAAVAFVCASALPLRAQDCAQPLGAESALAGIDAAKLERTVRERFSPQDLDRLSEYFTDLVAGREAFLPRDLRRRIDDLISELRLEYGFQIAVLLAHLERSVKRLLQDGIERIAPPPRRNTI